MTGQEKRKKKSQVLLKTNSWKALFLLRTYLLHSMILMTSSMMMTDIYLKHPIAKYGFPWPKLSEDDDIEFVVWVKTWLSNPIVTEEDKNFLVTLPRHLLLVSSRRRLFVSRLVSDKFDRLFLCLKSGYSNIQSRILQLFLVSEPGKLLERNASLLIFESCKLLYKLLLRSMKKIENSTTIRSIESSIWCVDVKLKEG